MHALTVAEIADRLQATFDGDGSIVINGAAGIRNAGNGEITYLSQARYARVVAQTRASAIIVGKDWPHPSAVPLIKVDDPEAAFSTVAQWYAPPSVSYLPGIHPTAVISPDAIIGKDVHIGPYVVIGRDVSLGDRTVLVGHNYIADGVSIGIDGLIHPNVSIREHVKIGHRVILHNGAVIGSDGFGYDVSSQGVRTKITQIGIVEIGDDVEIGANTTVDRARFGKTTIGHGVKIDNLVMIAHNVNIGDHSVVIAQAGIAGSTMIGEHVLIAGQAGLAGHLVIGDRAVISAQTGIIKDVPPKAFMVGFPAATQKEFCENQVHLRRVPALRKRIAELEERIIALEKNNN